MKLDLEKWSLVILGNWNTSILSPNWLSNEILHVKKLTIQFPVLGGGSPLFGTENMAIIVKPNKLTFAPISSEDDTLVKIEQAAKSVLEKLSYTPIKAFGQNFHFVVSKEEMPKQCEEIFNLSDDEKISVKGEVLETSIIRSIKIDSAVLNLKIEKNEHCHISLNYHYVVNKAEEAVALISNTFIKNKKHGLDLLRDVYGLELEEETSV